MNPELETRPADQWIQTYTGKQFWPLDPRPEEICIEDIAHALSMKCRFTGHTRHFYSVAQHCVIASHHCYPHQGWALLHDAGEAYLPDVARPVKRAITDFERIENRILEAVAERYGLSLPVPEEVHAIDLRMLATERRQLMSSPPAAWLVIENVQPLPWIIESWAPSYAKQRFLDRFEQLFGREQST